MEQPKDIQTAELLHQMGFSTFSTSVLLETLKANENDVDRTIDHLLTMKARLDQSVLPARVPAADPSADEAAQQMRLLQVEQLKLRMSMAKVPEKQDLPPMQQSVRLHELFGLRSPKTRAPQLCRHRFENFHWPIYA
jgi:hypothetical protein